MRGFKLDRGYYVPNGAVRVDHPLGAHVGVAYYYSTPRSLAALLFSGKRKAPDWHRLYRTNADRDAAIAESFEGLTRAVEYSARKRAERAAFQHTLKVGDILHTSWGYDQTNVEFFRVAAVRGKVVDLEAIDQETTETGFMCGETKPVEPVVVVKDWDPRVRLTSKRVGPGNTVRICDTRTAYPGGGTRRVSWYA